MKYLFDIGHPAHVHYFKNLIWNLEKKGHEIKITTRKKEMSLYLLNKYGFNYVCTGENAPTTFGKAISIIKNDYWIYKESKTFNPDILISFFLPFTAHVGRVLRKPVIGFTDTEHATLNILLAEKFTDVIITPECYKRKLPENKHIRFNGYFELAYLHPNYFKPDPSILDLLEVEKGEKYVIMRFVSWAASHDFKSKGFSKKSIVKMLKFFSKEAKIFITSETPLPKAYDQYKFNIPPEKLHSALYYADLCLSDGSTTAVEASVLGTPTVHFESYRSKNSELDVTHLLGYLNELSNKYELFYTFKDEDKVLKKALEFLTDKNSKKKCREKAEKLIENKIDVTAFMVDVIENYPESCKEENK